MEARVLVTFSTGFHGPDGRSYVAKVCGRPTPNGRWEGWIEFVPDGGTPVLRSRRETTQPNLTNIEGWAERLSEVYLEGSFERTLEMQPPKRVPAAVRPEAPHFDGPSPADEPPEKLAPDDAVLNPVLRLREGEDVLRTELAELAPAELRTIARAYRVDEDDAVEVEALSAEALVELIVEGARRRVR